MEQLEATATVHAPPPEVFELLADFPSYVEYTDYLEAVEATGSGDAGTEYTMHFAWWRVEYSVRSVVTDLDPPRRIEFELVEGLEAEGAWEIAAREAAPEVSDIRFVIRYDPGTIGGDAVSLPSLISLGTVIDRAKPYLLSEAEGVLERIVEELEGEPRSVEVTLRT